MTNRLERQIAIGCPFAQAARRLDRFFRVASPLPLEHAVSATIHVATRAHDLDPRYRIEWAATDPGSFPMFAGELHVEGHGDRDCFALIVRGEYEPPFGPTGAAFDPAIGRDVATAIAIDLLQQIRTSIERECADDGARKSGSTGQLHVVNFGRPRTKVR